MFVSKCLILLLFHPLCSGRMQAKTACEGEDVSIKCENSGPIKIVKAFYGRETRSICQGVPPGSVTENRTGFVLTSVLENMCDWEMECNFTVIGEFLADICPGVSKYLSLVFYCREPISPSITCENDHITRLVCDNGKRIKVLRAEYGRDNLAVCYGTRSPAYCPYMDVTSNLKLLCDGSNACEAKFSDFVRRELCPWTSKYLKLSYVCVNLIQSATCEDGHLQMGCDEGVMHIEQAQAGKLKPNTKCASFQGMLAIEGVVNLFDKSSYNYFRTICEGKKNCTYNSDDLSESSEANGYFRVFYSCRKTDDERMLVCYIDEARGKIAFDLIGQKCTHVVYRYKYIEPEKLVIKTVSRFYGTSKLHTMPDMINAMRKDHPGIKLMSEVVPLNEDALEKLYESPANWRKVITACVYGCRLNSHDGIVLDVDAFLGKDASKYSSHQLLSFIWELKMRLNTNGYILMCRIHYKSSSNYDVQFILSIADYVEVTQESEFLHVPYASPLEEEDDAEFDEMYTGNIILSLFAKGLKQYLLFKTPEVCCRNVSITNVEWVSFGEICRLFSEKRSAWTHFWSDTWDMAYSHSGDKIISYFTHKSHYKMLKVVAKYGLKGVSFEPQFDDADGSCYGRRFPLLNAIAEYQSDRFQRQFRILTSQVVINLHYG